MAKEFTNLVEMYESSIKAFGPNPLFGTKRDGAYKWMTYQKFGEITDSFRGALATLGVTKGDTVAIIANNRVEWAVAAHATYGLGARFCPMYEAQMPKDWKYILNDSEAKVLLVANEEIYKKTLPFVDEISTLERVIYFDGKPDHNDAYDALLEHGKHNPADLVYPESEDICGFIYTSGTTGNPKGVLLSHGNICSNINGVQSLLDIDSNDVSLSFLPWAHSFGQTVELHVLFSKGASMGLAESVNTILQNLSEVRPTLLFSVPRIFNRIYDGVHKKMEAEGGIKHTLFTAGMENSERLRAAADAGKDAGFMVNLKDKLFDKVVFSKVRDRFGGRLRYAFSGGAALAPDVAKFIDNLHITVYEGYGLTETSPIVTCNRPGARRIGSVGKPLPGVEVILQHVEGYDDPNVGEVCVKGPNIMKGYHNLPEQTAEVIDEDGTFHTGDLGRLDADGFLYIIGRVKEQYKLENGKYVVPAPLEEELKLSPYVNQIMIEGTNKPYNVALVVLDQDTLKEWCAANNVGESEALNHPKLHETMKSEVDRVGHSFKGYEKPKKFLLVSEEFSTENDMLTPKMSVKRRVVMEKYGEALMALYNE
ncbi:long-chain fatty acid--CoA ligase [Microvenator marinus]|uniref:Long-chain fatty acid--CoA ligase n=1 Tax=Microvenator marinus TaxID=2600177 RepID=A0A5B8XPQ5_9DELT|nr:long-chain fatty acid--CoA ligase [Microvenator marinus]QED27251.1 long-chain fatty acid--CoA ligase [Microvenator marinus]